MQQLFSNFAIPIGNLVMFAIGGILIYLAIKKDYEPMLLLPIGFGAILTNIPGSSAIGEHGVLTILYEAGIANELFPALIFIGIGAMIDFTPLLQKPIMFFYGAAAQLGIFLTIIVAAILGFDIREAISIGIIGTADGPTSIYVASRLAPHMLGPISVAAYSYMALVPVVQRPIIRLMTTKDERRIRMDNRAEKVPKYVKILFPIFVTILAGIVAPVSVALIGMLMFGNLIRECGVLNKLSNAAQNELSNLITLFLGITIGSTMTSQAFLNMRTLLILAMGLVAFILDTMGGIAFAKIFNLFRKQKINPMIGAAGISAFPMSARVVHKLGLEEDPNNFLIMYATGANVAGQIGSVLAGSIVLALFI